MKGEPLEIERPKSASGKVFFFGGCVYSSLGRVLTAATVAMARDSLYQRSANARNFRGIPFSIFRFPRKKRGMENEIENRGIPRNFRGIPNGTENHFLTAKFGQDFKGDFMGEDFFGEHFC